MASVDMIDKNTHEIRQALDDYDEARVYKSLKEVSEDLPDHTPRFVLLSYPITTVRFFIPACFTMRVGLGLITNKPQSPMDDSQYPTCCYTIFQ